ncbi:MAG: HEPN domain-containing protein [Candidatus Hydrogenedentes bacterium]|nr:HEPN domain-containing protein [Candidatus Hydrogenedentota bacterium]
MTEFAEDQWSRALNSLRAAHACLEVDLDSAASRAYYAVFHAVTALFALRGQHFTKHTGLRAAVHRDLVHAGEWREELGGFYDDVMGTREIEDYGEGPHVDREGVELALREARAILEAVSLAAPGHFPIAGLPEL